MSKTSNECKCKKIICDPCILKQTLEEDEKHERMIKYCDNDDHKNVRIITVITLFILLAFLIAVLMEPADEEIIRCAIGYIKASFIGTMLSYFMLDLWYPKDI